MKNTSRDLYLKAASELEQRIQFLESNDLKNHILNQYLMRPLRLLYAGSVFMNVSWMHFEAFPATLRQGLPGDEESRSSGSSSHQFNFHPPRYISRPTYLWVINHERLWMSSANCDCREMTLLSHASDNMTSAWQITTTARFVFCYCLLIPKRDSFIDILTRTRSDRPWLPTSWHRSPAVVIKLPTSWKRGLTRFINILNKKYCINIIYVL